MTSAAKRLSNALLLRSDVGKRLSRSYGLRGYLDSCGWFRSVEEQVPVDQAGDSLPWYTYPSISFLKERIHSEMAVFEFGSGNSTLWWSKRVSSVTSCEHDMEWFKTLKSKLPQNVDYMHRELDGGHYSGTILEHEGSFEIVVVDGRDRVQCAKNSLGALKGDGVIVWDNSDREQYEPGYAYLLQNGFRRIDFWGLGPINNYQWCTSIFYRDENCLGI